MEETQEGMVRLLVMIHQFLPFGEPVVVPSLQYRIPVEVQHYLQIHRNCRLVMVKGVTNLQPGGNFRMISLERQIRFNSLRC